MINLLDLIYPSVCGFCNKINKEGLCNKCNILLKKYEIYKCTENKNNIDEMVNVYRYEGIIRKKLIDYKFGEQSYLFRSFSKILLRNKKLCNFMSSYDIMIPVPTHKKRKRQRGYNQTELIAKEISKILNLEYNKNVLIKEKNVESQSTLSQSQRIKNVKGAFKIMQKDFVQGKKVILFDDIYTTGSTVEECVRELRKINVKRIGVVTLAKK